MDTRTFLPRRLTRFPDDSSRPSPPFSILSPGPRTRNRSARFFQFSPPHGSNAASAPPGHHIRLWPCQSSLCGAFGMGFQQTRLFYDPSLMSPQPAGERSHQVLQLTCAPSSTPARGPPTLSLYKSFPPFCSRFPPVQCGPSQKSIL